MNERTLPTTQVDGRSRRIDFALGQPDFDLLPHDLIQHAAAERLAEGDNELLNYGYEQGDGRFRAALATFLSEGYGTSVLPDSLMVTAGASQALSLICTLFTRPGDTVFVEEPSYFIALRILREDHQLKPVSIPTDEHGLIPEAVEEALAVHSPRLLYTIPTFQNPSGVTLSQPRRERLVQLAEAHDFLIVADEVYHLLDYGEPAGDPPPAPLAAQIESGRVLSVGSFSKILAPGLRLGWVQSAPEHVQRFVTCGLVSSGGGLNHFTSNIVRVVLESGEQAEYLARLRDTYRRRIQAMDRVLREAVGDRAQWQTPRGGYFFWLAFPEGTKTASWLAAAHEQDVGFLPGPNCSSEGGLENYMRLSFAHYSDVEIERGIARLGQVIGRRV